VRPFGATRDPEDQLGGLSVDGNIGYVRTEDLDRLGYDVGVGYTFQATPSFAIGPIVRYHQIVQPDQLANRDPNDAQFLTIGLNLGFSPKYTEEPELTCPDAPECVQETPVVAAVPTPCADRDKDGTCDDVDRCPTQMGPVASFGCPIDPCSGKPLVVSVQFDYDSARLPLPKDGPESMDPVLDAVAAAISRDPSCRVCISGYASEEGTDPYNLKLSRKRASAVQSYMVARGLTEARLPSIGMGEGCQLMPEESRELNRRVEFLALEGDETCPTACAE
jgi:outer membrane protein OmpA-like peptidoglycan-associated protein